MHPLNTFPALLDFVRIAPFILRLTIGIFIIYLGINRKNKELNWLSYFYFIFGATLILGFYTQISSLVGVVLLKTDFYLEYWKDRKINPISTNCYFLYAVGVFILISMLITGAGFLALDMPF